MTLTEAILVPVNSTVLASLAYDASGSILQLEFCNGAIYRYSAVPAAVYHSLLAADSKGSYFNREIRTRFPHSLIRRPA
jgi:KTSC domain